MHGSEYVKYVYIFVISIVALSTKLRKKNFVAASLQLQFLIWIHSDVSPDISWDSS